MRRSIVFFLVLFLVACQKPLDKKILGDWEVVDTKVYKLQEQIQKLKEFYNASDTSQIIIQEKQRLITLQDYLFPRGIIFTFKEDSTFYQQGTEGTWTLNLQDSIIIVRLTQYNTSKFKILSISKDSLKLIYENPITVVPSYYLIRLVRLKK